VTIESYIILWFFTYFFGPASVVKGLEWMTSNPVTSLA
jgi:hypothetical protein